jgi:hypothetical protein
MRLAPLFHRREGMWDLIIVTAQTQDLANAACASLRTSSNHIRSAQLLAVADPSTASPVGSGGSVLNAIVVAGEELSARGGHTTLSVEPLRSARVIVLQVATTARGGSPHPCLPQALTAVPAVESATVLSGVSLTLRSASVLMADMPPGLVIASTDSIITLPAQPTSPLPLMGGAGTVVALPLPLQHAVAHGVCVPGTSPTAKSTDLGSILYRSTEDSLRAYAAPDGTVGVYTGLIYLAATTATKLLELHVKPVRRAGSEPTHTRPRKLEAHSSGCCSGLHALADVGSFRSHS